jgi:CBS domain containing-hemolysin-like protein
MKKDNWILKAFLITFFIALIFSSASNVLISNYNNSILLIIICVIFILIGIIFDIIGTAVLTGNEATFHAKSAKKIKGSKEGVYLIKNSNRVSSICNDVIGDICGIVSGSVCAMLSIKVSINLNISVVLTTLVISSIISSLTVGGKAIGKKYAIKNSDNIIFVTAKILSKLKKMA